MVKLITTDNNEHIVLYANETKAHVFQDIDEAKEFFKYVLEQEAEKKAMLQEKLEDERMDDLRAEYSQDENSELMLEDEEGFGPPGSEEFGGRR